MTLFLAVLLSLPVSQSGPECPGGQTLLRAEIESSGAMYISDVVAQFDAIRLTSTAGFAWSAFHGSGSPSAGNEIAVFVDGMYQQQNLFGEQDLNRLALPMGSIESVTFCPTSRLVDGVFASNGSLHVTTRRVEEGIHGRASGQIGNEIGDPGPFRYTDLATQNVDKFGPDAELGVSWSGPQASARIAGRLGTFYATDNAIRHRARAVAEPGPLNEEYLKGWADAAFSSGGASFQLQTGRFENERFWFFEAAGRELPVLQTETSARLRVATDLGQTRFGTTTADARAGLHRQEMVENESTLEGFQPDWMMQTLTGSAELRAETQQQSIALGGRVQRVSAEGSFFEFDGTTVGQVYASRERRPRRGIFQRTDLAAVFSSSGARLKFAQELSREVSGADVALSIGIDGSLPEERASYHYWSEQGYRRNFLLSGIVQSVPTTESSTEAFGRLQVQGQLAQDFSGRVAIEGRSFRGLQTTNALMMMAPRAVALEGQIELLTRERGESVGLHASVQGERGFFSGRVFYSLLTDVSGSTGFERAWSRVPTHRGGAVVTIRPNRNFSMWVSVTGLSETRWAGYEAIDGIEAPSGHIFSSTIPARLVVDSAVSKHIWNRRARVSLQFRNLLNTEERYHAVGAALDFRVFGRLDIRL